MKSFTRRVLLNPVLRENLEELLETGLLNPVLGENLEELLETGLLKPCPWEKTLKSFSRRGC